jgi:hypothetical protein
MSPLDSVRLREALEQLKHAGYAVLAGGCCPSCNWRQICEDHPDAIDIIHFNDQSLDSAFGGLEPTPEWRAYLDGAGDDEDEAEWRLDEWLSHWGDDEHPAAQRPGMLSQSLWIQHSGDAARAVEIMRCAGLDAVWDGDKDRAIEVRPRVQPGMGLETRAREGSA